MWQALNSIATKKEQPEVSDDWFAHFRAVEVYRRAGKLWTAEIYLPGDTVVLSSIDVRIPVDDPYRRSTVPEGRHADPPPDAHP